MKKKTNAQLKRKLWPIFAAFIKRRDNFVCYTCGRRVEGGNCHAGHFIPKGAGGLALYFHEDNVHVQCAGCNLFLAGNQYIYGQKLGEEKVKELYRIKNQITKDYPFEEKIKYYQQKLKEYDSDNNPFGDRTV